MKVLVASSAPTDGGAGISAYSKALAASLSEAGHEVHYAAPSPDDRSFLERHGLTHVPTDQDVDPHLSSLDLVQHIRDQGIEGCINNDNPVLQSIAPALPVSLTTICHMDRRIVGSLCALHADWVDHLVCISNDMHRTMVKRYGFRNTKCRIIHNGTVDPGHSGNFNQLEPATIRLVCSGGWDSNKGGPRILRSILSNRNLWKNVGLDWFGAVPDRIQRKLSNFPGIRFRGQVSQSTFHATLAEADILVFASSKEGCPMTMLEAMSRGVLPIATDGVGAMRWLIDSGREGFICHLEDWERQLSECVEFLSNRPDVVSSMKRAARDRYLRDFQASNNAERILDLVRRPTVDRTKPAKEFDIVRWHRPVGRSGRRLTVMERLRYRTGWLDRIGPFEGTFKES